MIHSDSAGTSNFRERIFFSAGEPSGDAHAAALIREIKSQDQAMRCVGYGGPLMEQAGMELHCDLTKKAVMFLGISASQIYSFYKLYKQTQKYFSENRVKAVVLVDYPGFNWWVARAAKQQDIPVYYFMPPQLWAWAGWRVKKMQRFVDHVFTTMPFETKWFREHDCHVIEIGHPFLKEAKHRKVDTSFVECLKSDGQPILTILPGSRDQEIAHNFDDLLNTVEKVQREAPNVRPMVAAFKQEHADQINKKLSERGMAIPVYADKTQELIRAAHFALTVSGSVTMELLANHVPTVVYYKINKIGHFAQRFFRRSRFITLVNLLGVEQFTPGSPYYPKKMKVIPAWPTERDIDDMLFPEFLTSEDMSGEAADSLLVWHKYPDHYRLCKEKLQILHQKLDPVVDPFRVAVDVLLKRKP
ncbi:MAG: hypothetical protein FWD31_03415 [Planctomycetaceae bacterium]|nr:hypothetical protein [Planctomycetaceae bacterium]